MDLSNEEQIQWLIEDAVKSGDYYLLAELVLVALQRIAILEAEVESLKNRES